jgi:cytochrome c553
MKHARDLTEAERIAALKEFKLKELQSGETTPLDMSRMAKDMSEQEKIEWLAAHRKRFA